MESLETRERKRERERERERQKHGSCEPFSPFDERHASVACSVLITGLSFRRTSPRRVGVSCSFFSPPPLTSRPADGTGGKRRRSFRVALQPEVVHFCPVSARISLMRLTVARFHCPRGPNIRRSVSFRARRWKWQSAVRSNFFLLLRAENVAEQ